MAGRTLRGKQPIVDEDEDDCGTERGVVNNFFFTFLGWPITALFLVRALAWS